MMHFGGMKEKEAECIYHIVWSQMAIHYSPNEKWIMYVNNIPFKDQVAL